MSLSVKAKTIDTVKCEVVDGGELKSRRHLNVRGKSATLPSITGLYSLHKVRISKFYTFLDSRKTIVKYIEYLYIKKYYVLTEKDWEDIKFGVDNKVDFYALSFVKDAKVVCELKAYLKSKVLINTLSVNIFTYILV